MRVEPDDLASRRRMALALWVASCALRLGLAARWDVLADEAYYWSWGQDPALGYFDHPPLLAWLLAPWPPHALAIRLPGWLITSVGGGALVMTTPHPRTLAALLAVLPPMWLWGTLATPDAPLLGLWMLAVAAATHGRWGATAALTGLAALAKYPGLALAALAVTAPRLATRRPSTWLGIAVAVAVVLPHAAWSFTSGHPSLWFQASHGLGGGPEVGVRWWGPLQLASQQLALSGGLLGVAAAVALVRQRGSVAWWSAAPLLGVFGVASLRAPTEANWLAPAWIGAALLLAEAAGSLRRVVQTGVWLTLLMSLLALAHVEWPLWPSPTDPALRLQTGRSFADTAAKFVVPAPGEPRRLVLTERYQEASWLRWHHDVPAVVWSGCGRPNQLDSRPPANVGDEAWFVRPRTGGPPDCVLSDWSVVEQRSFREHTPDGRALGAWDVFLLRRP